MKYEVLELEQWDVAPYSSSDIGVRAIVSD